MDGRISFLDLAAVLKSTKTLVIADVHMGYEEAIGNQGVLLPRFQLRESLKRLERILRVYSPETIVIAGDIKHEFGTISEQEWKDTLRLIDFLSARCKRLVLVKGNHDTVLGPIAKKRGLEIVDHYITGDVMIAHGHKVIAAPKGIKTVVIGHEHPAVAFRSSARDERYKCFLVGIHDGRELVVLPSFNPVAEGTDVLSEDLLSPYLADVSDFSVHVPDEADGKVRFFGRIKDLREE